MTELVGRQPGAGPAAGSELAAEAARPAPAEVLAAYAPAAGLPARVVPFGRARDARELRDLLARNPFLMAPMAGVSDSAYRLMARCGGAALAYTEMVSVAGIHYGGDKTWELAWPHDPEPDIAVQLFGSKPDQFREAAAGMRERLGNRLALIDINMACPVPKVTRKGEGSALMDDPALSARIVRACLDEAGVVVTVKIRRGRVDGVELAPEFARAMEDAGACAVAVHGRYASQYYRGQADWGVVSRVVDAVDVPVIASGDILTPQAAVRVLSETGATAAMVARGSYGNPWIFSDARCMLAGEEPPVRDWAQRVAAFACHARLLAATGAHMARARSLATWYLRGMPEASHWRGRAMRCDTLEEFLALADELQAAMAGAGACAGVRVGTGERSDA